MSIKIFGEGGSALQIWKDSKYAFQEKQGRGGGVRQSRKFPDYSGFFLLKASLRIISKKVDETTKLLTNH